MKPVDILLHEPALPAQEGQRSHLVLRTHAPTGMRSEMDQIADETAVALEYNGISHAALLATPCNLEDLAYGFSFTEGIIRGAQDMRDIEVVERSNGLVIQMTIASSCLNQLKLRRRSLAGRTGCGLCGIESLDEVRRELPAVAPRRTPITRAAISSAASHLRTLQPLHLATGATHAAGWASPDGLVEHIREDVGRHNALDKLIGHLLRHGIATTDGMAFISSRASFEMVQKAAAAGISALIAVSAPTSYAIRIASELNIMLAGFAREQQFTIYSHPEYLSHEGDLF